MEGWIYVVCCVVCVFDGSEVVGCECGDGDIVGDCVVIFGLF